MVVEVSVVCAVLLGATKRSEKEEFEEEREREGAARRVAGERWARQGEGTTERGARVALRKVADDGGCCGRPETEERERGKMKFLFGISFGHIFRRICD